MILRFGLPMVLMGIGAAGLLILAACDSNSQNSSQSDPTTRALSDPMGYSPNFDDTGVTDEKGMADSDPQGLKRDMDHVLNPP
jgi:hypothetical protein